jgi:hypothetical protein
MRPRPRAGAAPLWTITRVDRLGTVRSGYHLSHPAILPPRPHSHTARMTESLWTRAPTHIVVHEVMNHINGMPVRAIQALLSRSEEPIEFLRIALRVNIEADVPDLSHWGVVAAAVLGHPGTLPELLAHLPLAAQRRCIGLGFAAAEAVAQLGPDAEEELLAAAASIPPDQRYWHCYAAALGSSASSLEFLVRQLVSNPAVRDIASLGLAHRRCDELPVVLRRVMKRVHAWQRGTVEWALAAYGHDRNVFGQCTPDWRLRYRYQPGWIDFPGLVPCVAALVRSTGEYRDFFGRPGPCRSVDDVLAGPPEPPPETPCVLCEAPGFNVTGAHACQRCAPRVAAIQSDGLLAAGGAFPTEDIFDALDWIELRHLRLSSEPMARDAPARLDECQRALLTLGGVRWLVEAGVERTCEGAAALLAAAEAPACGRNPKWL